MWIRSQDGMSLMDCNSFAVQKFFEQYEVITLNSSSRITVELGTYSSEKKALKVLDEIQRIIEYPGSSLISPTALQNYYRLSPTGQIYQMPQDDEVEVWS